jgi:hypothetical protein
VERTLASNFGPEGRSRRAPSTARSFLTASRYRVFLSNDREITYFLTRNPLFGPIRASVVTARYALLGEMCGVTSLYSANPPMLFLDETTNSSSTSYFAEHSAALVETIADNVARAAEDLKRRGVRLLFLPIPNSITIYADLVTDTPYDAYISRVVAAVRARGVCSLDLMPVMREMRARGEDPYYPTDTHWTQAAMERTTSLVVAAMSSWTGKTMYRPASLSAASVDDSCLN